MEFSENVINNNKNNNLYIKYSILEEFIYIGDIYDKYVTLISLDNGKFYNLSNITDLKVKENNNNNIKNAQLKLEDLSNYGEYYKNVYITYIPSKEVEDITIIDKLHTTLNDNLRKPLIKIKNSLSGSYSNTIKAFKSGRRSAIIKYNNRYIRLKGCGNIDIGFNIVRIEEISNHIHLETQGSQFKNTCLRELYVSQQLNNITKSDKLIYKNTIKLTNYPLGYWIYPRNKEIYMKYNLINDAELIEKYCGIYETYTEKRLGEHLFKGINKLLNICFEYKDYFELVFTNNINELDLININKISKLLPNNNYTDKNNIRQICFNDYLFINDKVFEVNLNNINNNANINNNNNNSIKLNNIKLFNLNKYLENLLNKNINLKNKLIEKERKITLTIINKIKHCLLNKNESLYNEFKTLENNINNLLKSNSLFILIINLLSKIAFECGKIIKVFEELNLNWGTFDYHSNTHLDNFTILKSSNNNNNNNNLLGVLDFDLAFFENEFIDLKYKNNKDSKDTSYFKSLKYSEKINLLLQLSGINTINNINAHVLNLDIDKINFNELINKSFILANLESFKNLCYENIHYYFILGYNFVNNEESELDLKYNEINTLVKLLLLLEAL